MNKRTINIKLADGAQAPWYATVNSAGADIYALITEFEKPSDKQPTMYLAPKERKLIPTGIYLGLPDDCEVQIRPRSGMALKYGITVLNSPGTIDGDYRGHVQVILYNSSDTTFGVHNGDRIAQMVLVENVVQADWSEVESLDETERGENGFGASGINILPACFIEGEFGSISEHCGKECPEWKRCAKSPGKLA